jgi:hypothetical protein
MTNIRLDLQAMDEETTLHPQLYVQSLGIKWVSATPCIMVDAWWFCECSNLPDPLPPSITIDDRPAERIRTLGYTFYHSRPQ